MFSNLFNFQKQKADQEQNKESKLSGFPLGKKNKNKKQQQQIQQQVAQEPEESIHVSFNFESGRVGSDNKLKYVRNLEQISLLL